MHLWEEQKNEEGQCQVVRVCLGCLEAKLVKRPNYATGTDIETGGNGE